MSQEQQPRVHPQDPAEGADEGQQEQQDQPQDRPQDPAEGPDDASTEPSQENV